LNREGIRRLRWTKVFTVKNEEGFIMSKKYLYILAFVITISFLLTGCGQNNENNISEGISDKPVAVSIARVEREDIGPVISLSGKVKPSQEANIISKIPGRVNKVYVDVGQRVNKGDTLFTLDEKDIRLQLAQAQAGLDIAKAALKRSKGGSVELQLVQLKSALATAEINYYDAKQNYDRARDLYEADASSKQTLEAAESRMKIVEEQYNSAKSSYEVTKSKIIPENVEAAEAQLRQAQAAYAIASDQLDNTIIKSSLTGVVASKNVSEGDLVGSTGIAMSVIDISSMVVEVNVPENYINKIKVNDSVDVLVKAASERPFEGSIVSVSPTADARTMGYPVKVQIHNDGGLLKGGMFAEINLVTGRAENALAVPISSLIDEDGRKIIYVVDGNRARKREVKTGCSNDRFVQVIKGLQYNERVVVKGQNFLQDGSIVTVTE
jgi:HlyD family secretion protein